MKKILITMIVLMLALVVVNGVMAWGGPGNGMRGGYGCPYAAGYTADVTPEQAQKVAAFQQSIQPLQQKVFQLRNEIWTLRNQQNPDWNAISSKQKEMVDLRTQIQKLAVDSGVTGVGYGYGPRGRGMGRW
jgi:Spy/CpxP family protein refolding chaperone